VNFNKFLKFVKKQLLNIRWGTGSHHC